MANLANVVEENPLKLNFLRILNSAQNISRKALVVNFTCLHCVNTKLRDFQRPWLLRADPYVQSNFRDNIKYKHSRKLFFRTSTSTVKVLRLAMKVDEHKYYDGFLGAINDALAGAWEKFSVGLNKNVNGMKSLSLDSRAQLSTSHTVRMERRKEKKISAQCLDDIHANDFTYRYQTTHLEVRWWAFRTFWQLL